MMDHGWFVVLWLYMRIGAHQDILGLGPVMLVPGLGFVTLVLVNNTA